MDKSKKNIVAFIAALGATLMLGYLKTSFSKRPRKIAVWAGF